MISYKQVLGYCVSTVAESEDKSDEAILAIIDNFSSLPNWDRNALFDDLKRHFSIIIGGGATLVDDGHIPWLDQRRAKIDPFYWKRYQKYLEQSGFAPLPLAEMDKIADNILGLMDDPTRPGPWDRRGMVLGHVQSGKTANYIGLINKAADAGYKVVIVIAGIHNNLRNQTQRRIDEGFRGIASADIKKSAGHSYVGVGSINPNRQPSSFTTTVKDFNKAAAQQVGVPMSNLVEPAVFVIKKNASTLRSLIDWLRQYSGEGHQNQIDEPLLIIDDEADNASINTSKDPKRATRINALIRELLGTFTRSSYVGYTATPFANIFVDPETDDEMLGRDLFPKDFLISLDAPSNYFGPAKIFDKSDPSPVVRDVDDIDTFVPSVHKSSYAPDALPPSLEKAIRTFVLTRAIRIHRGQATEHSSMMVNVSQFVQTQLVVERLIHNYLDQIRNQIRLYGHWGPELSEKYHHMSVLAQTYVEEFGNIEEGWHEIYPLLWESISPIQVKTINGRSRDVLDYAQHKESGLHVIAVGGYSLSRGLTLEGLSTSYLSRNSKQYDTIMQMGRWFGYRPEYEDLCRIWLPPVVTSWYEHITDATEELRDDILSMQQAGATPADFGLRVRSHPETLLVTARNKMGSGELLRARFHLDKTLIETAKLSNIPATLNQNLAAASDLTKALNADPTLIQSVERGTRIFHSTPKKHVIQFLSKWQNHAPSYRTDPEKLIEFISERPEELGVWDVAFPGVIKNGLAVDVQYSDFPILMQERSIVDGSTRSEMRIGSRLRVMSPRDEAIGLSDRELQEARDKRGIGLHKVIPGPDIRATRSRPLLLVHYLNIIDKDENHLIEQPVIAWSISFPGTTNPGEPLEYLVNSKYLEEFQLDYGTDEDFEEDAD